MLKQYQKMYYSILQLGGEATTGQIMRLNREFSTRNKVHGNCRVLCRFGLLDKRIVRRVGTGNGRMVVWSLVPFRYNWIMPKIKAGLEAQGEEFKPYLNDKASNMV
jgi:hypothetical protein